MRDIGDVYAGSTDPFKNFQLKMVLAISMQKLSKQFAGLADSYFLAGLQHMEDVLEPMDHRTLQCLLVMAQYALTTPTRMAVRAPRTRPEDPPCLRIPRPDQNE